MVAMRSYGCDVLWKKGRGFPTGHLSWKIWQVTSIPSPKGGTMPRISAGSHCSKASSRHVYHPIDSMNIPWNLVMSILYPTLVRGIPISVWFGRQLFLHLSENVLQWYPKTPWFIISFKKKCHSGGCTPFRIHISHEVPMFIHVSGWFITISVGQFLFGNQSISCHPFSPHSKGPGQWGPSKGDDSPRKTPSNGQQLQHGLKPDRTGLFLYGVYIYICNVYHILDIIYIYYRYILYLHICI